MRIRLKNWLANLHVTASPLLCSFSLLSSRKFISTDRSSLRNQASLSISHVLHTSNATDKHRRQKYSKELSMQCPMKIVQSSWSKKEQCCNITTTIFVRAYPRCPCYTGATHHCAECHLRYSSLYMIRDNKFFKWTLP